jgi:glycosyltransferase involved in cell wall biosynthesis
LIRRFKKFRIISWGIENRFIETKADNAPGRIRKEYNIDDRDKIILSYRNHRDVYNHRTLIRAIPEISARFPNTKFIFTKGSSDPRYVRQTRQLVEELNIQDHFIFIDKWLSTDDLIQLVKGADINVNIPLADGLPATLFEIMSSPAVPVIGKLENYHEFFEDGKNGYYLHDLSSPNELAGIIIQVLDSLDKFKGKFFDTNIKYVREYQNWKIKSEQFLDLYKFGD